VAEHLNVEQRHKKHLSEKKGGKRHTFEEKWEIYAGTVVKICAFLENIPWLWNKSKIDVWEIA